MQFLSSQFEFNISQIEILEDPTLDVSINDLLSFSSKYQFKPLESNSKNLGFSHSAYWLKVSLKNNCDNQKVLLFSINYALINNILYYETSKNKIQYQA